jgi:tripartite-type tricarboxylate transporter receptor subunit TctC
MAPAIMAPAIMPMTVEKQASFSIDSNDAIGNPVTDPKVLLVHKDSAMKSLGDVAAFAKAVADPEYKEAAGRAMIPVDYRDPAQHEAMLRQMHADLSAVWQASPWC